MKRRLVTIVLATGVAAAACSKPAATGEKKAGDAMLTSTPPPEVSTRVAAWREDLRALATELPTRHVDPFFHIPEAEWRAAVAALDGRLETLDDAQVEAELMRLVAMIGDGHTGLAPAKPRSELYPLAMYWFNDGIFVVDATGDAAWAKGHQLVGVGGRGLDEVIELLAPLIARDNDSQLRSQLPQTVIDPLLLRGAGLAETTTRASFTLRAPDGSERTLETAPGPAWQPTPPAGTQPLAMQRRHSHYWNDYVADQRLYYFQYLQCADAPDLPFAKLAASTLGFADLKPIDRFVIDLRFNGGGNSLVIKPLIDGLVARPALAKKVYVLIGRRTFSSALLNAIELKRRVGAVLVGEATGGKPSHHGEVKTFQLPRSTMTLFYSTKYFENSEFPGDALEPDLPASASYADFAALRDPGLEAIAAHTR